MVQNCQPESGGTRKELIMYHRSYRKLPGSLRLVMVQFLLGLLIFSAPFLFFYPQISQGLCDLSKALLKPFFFADTVKINATSYFHWIGSIHYLDLPGKLPTMAFSLGNVIFCLIIFIFWGLMERGKPVVILGGMITAIHLASSLFFLFWSASFPYNAANYSELYIKQQIGIWFFMPIILGISILPLPSSMTAKFGTLTIAVLYSLVFGALRYIVFLYIVSQVSMLYMAVLYFIFGPLIDFSYIIGIYSLHLSWFLKKSKGNFALWRWY